MPKLPSLTSRKFIKVLKSQGFIHHRTAGSHHIYIRIKDQKTISVPVHAGHDLGSGLLLKLIKDMDLTRDEFLKLM